ncbi:hypothetical protein SAMN05421771_2796 [Granulicella pectinivorans]|uniref:Lysylphosphatidylglycerol synthase TM region n=1 Tax=Granulicella pectinivorans TaxID=474950 RepID=A0A1I6MJK1_9BACT|nr:lysylphosphatidylglycerol synthase transmembrane domain-containing protein [Granulicella pectinivorans]SFS15852.1 hypothetical protein SAMN05421771_2796 [Granulicella pectinivorans]
MTRASASKLLKTLPGLVISAFFLWYTFWPRVDAHGLKKGVSPEEFRSLHIVAPIWIVSLIAFGIVSYSLRIIRWHYMMRSTDATLLTCARVFMTSLAANNILPFRIGDVMRVFTYAPDLRTTPSVILSTMLLEKLLDIFVLVAFFVVFLGPNASTHLRVTSHTFLGVSFVAIIVLLLGARVLEGPIRRLFIRLPEKPILLKLENWIILALECIRGIGALGSLLLLAETIVIWSAEGMQFLAAAKTLGIESGPAGPWQAVAWANLSFLVPSSPGGIGPFEMAIKTALVSHGADPVRATLYGLALHVWMLVVITGIGGAMFMAHRIRTAARKPLLQEIETLPNEL